ncbi:hypothetical protein MTO96_046601 [Rhipicephalus appendiculatus]
MCVGFMVLLLLAMFVFSDSELSDDGIGGAGGGGGDDDQEGARRGGGLNSVHRRRPSSKYALHDFTVTERSDLEQVH